MMGEADPKFYRLHKQAGDKHQGGVVVFRSRVAPALDERSFTARRNYLRLCGDFFKSR